ncbi:hypothetical protein Tco_1264212 [Tanacetum coccineum]
MAALKYNDDHNKITYLGRERGCEDFKDILRYLDHSPLRYALTHAPPVVFDSLVKQFWTTAIVRPNAAGSHDLVATIDGREVVVTESLIRTQLHFDDANGILTWPIPEILEGEEGYWVIDGWRLSLLLNTIYLSDGDFWCTPLCTVGGQPIPLTPPMLAIAAAGDDAAGDDDAANEAAGSAAEAPLAPHSPPVSPVREPTPEQQPVSQRPSSPSPTIPETEWVVPTPVSPVTDWRPWPYVSEHSPIRDHTPEPVSPPTPPAQTFIFEEPLVFGPEPRPAGYVDPDVIEPILFGPPPRPHGYVDPDFVEPIIFGPQPRPDNYLEPEDLDNVISMEDDTTHGGFHEESPVRPDDAPTPTADAAGRAEDPALLTSYLAKLDRVKKLEKTVKQLRDTRLVVDASTAEGDVDVQDDIDLDGLSRMASTARRVMINLLFRLEDLEEREEEEVPSRPVTEPAGPSVAADKGKAPMPDLDIPAEFLAEDAQARQRLEEEQANAVKERMKRTLADLTVSTLSRLNNGYLHDEKIRQGYESKIPAISEPPSKRQRVNSASSQPVVFPAATIILMMILDFFLLGLGLGCSNSVVQLQMAGLWCFHLLVVFFCSTFDATVCCSVFTVHVLLITYQLMCLFGIPHSGDIFGVSMVSDDGVVFVDNISDDEIVDPRVKVETITESAASPPRSRRKHLGVRSDDFLWDKPVEDFFSSESESDDDMENYIPPLPYGGFKDWEIDLLLLRRRMNRYFRLNPDVNVGLDLWRDVNMLCQSLHSDDVEDFWSTQDDWIVSSWKLYPKSSVHVLDLTNGKTVYMFVDKVYPIRATLLERMLRHRLTVPPSYCRDVFVAGNVIQTVQTGLRQAYECLASAPISPMLTARKVWLTIANALVCKLKSIDRCKGFAKNSYGLHPTMFLYQRVASPEGTTLGNDLYKIRDGCQVIQNMVRFSFPCSVGMKKWTSPREYRLLLASPEQTATGKDMSNPLHGCDGLPKTVRVFVFSKYHHSPRSDSYLVKAYQIYLCCCQDWKLLFFADATSFDSAVHRVHAVSFDAAVLDAAATVSAACLIDCCDIYICGLSINLSKSKLLGVVVSDDRVVQGLGANRNWVILKLFHGCKMGKNGCGIQKKLGNGADTYFWEDLWHGDMVLKQRYPRLYALEVKKTVDVASKLSQENLTWSFRRAPRSGVEQDQLTDLTTYMEGVVLGVTPDRWYWTLVVRESIGSSARKVLFLDLGVGFGSKEVVLMILDPPL